MEASHIFLLGNFCVWFSMKKNMFTLNKTLLLRCGNIYLADAKFCRGCGHRRGNVAGEAATD